MPLDDGDYLSWYSSEVTRYRDIEWKVAGYAGAFSLALVYMITDPKRELLKVLIESNRNLIILIILVFTGFLIWSETHIHRSLNTWRMRRDLLKNGKAKHGSIRGHLIARTTEGEINRTDLAYFIAFQSFVCLMGLFAVGVVASSFLAHAVMIIGSWLVLTLLIFRKA